MADNKNKRRAHDHLPMGLSRVKHIIAIGSGKGGVGKSTVATNFAMALKKSGATVGLLDADIYGPSQPDMLGTGKIQPKVINDYLKPLEQHGLKFMSIGLLLKDDQPVIWRGPLASKMIQQFLGNVMWGELDYLLVDLPPGSGDVQITLAQTASLTGAIIVTTPQDVALGVAQKGLQMFQHVSVPILGIIENMSGFTCPHCGNETAIFKEGGGIKMAERFGLDFLGRIPIDPDLMAGADSGVPLLLKNTDSPAARAFFEMAEKFETVMQEQAKVLSAEPETIGQSKDGNLVLDWADGFHGEYKAYDLRINCACAMCVSEVTGEKILDPKTVPLDIKIGTVDKVGRYAVAIVFSDGHNTGIYRFDRLRELVGKQEKVTKQSFNV
jgi:ATP-binding protein involved in chromosome partitioning